MTDDDADVNDKTLHVFYGKVYDVLLRRKTASGHPIDGMCTSGNCSWCKSDRDRDTNATGLLPLVAWFLKHGPHVSEGWTLTAKVNGFNAEDLHDTMLGIFIGSGPT